jgi:hypothetical protein
MQRARRGARDACTLSNPAKVVTDGRHSRSGCGTIRPSTMPAIAAGRAACSAGQNRRVGTSEEQGARDNSYSRNRSAERARLAGRPAVVRWSAGGRRRAGLPATARHHTRADHADAEQRHAGGFRNGSLLYNADIVEHEQVEVGSSAEQ